MYDSINLRLMQADTGGVSLLEEIPCFLENVGEHYYPNGNLVVTGELGCLKVSLNDYQMKVKEGSLCKWYLGNNFSAMGRGDTQRAIEKLSDCLHVPMQKAIVTRMDIAGNFIVQHPPEVYLNHLGELRYATRLKEPSGLYYVHAGGRECFYDKVKEYKNKRMPIPELYEGRNVLRYEQRYTQRIAKQFGVKVVTGAMLYDEVFYISLLNRWKDRYRAIQKIYDSTINFDAMKTRQQLYRMGVLSLIERAGGLLQIQEQISEAQKKGELTRKQAYDLKKVIKEVSAITEGIVKPNEAIRELDKKVSNAVKFYR